MTAIPHPAPRPSPVRVGQGWQVRQGRWGYLMVAASVLGLITFQLLPLVWAAGESLLRFNPITHAPLGFVGLDNYAALFSDAVFWRALTNTVVYFVGAGGAQLILGFGIALLLDRVITMTSLTRTAVIAALALSESVTALLWFTLLDQDTGLVNGLLQAVGLPAIGWLTTGWGSIISVILVTVWHDVGLIVLIYLAGMQALDDELFNAASVDGAGRWQQVWYLSVPLLKRSSLLAVFIVTISSVRIFTPISIMTMGGPSSASTNLPYYTYIQGVQNLDYGLGSAAAVCLVLLLLLITAVQGAVISRGSRS
jgi:ABC-type sugar transport system permease subunit